MLEAGCKKKKWTYNKDGFAERYEWVASGDLLEKGVCIEESYQKYFAPKKGRTKVHSTIEYQKVRKIDAKEQTLSIDLILTLQWLDPNIRTNFTTHEMLSQGVALVPEATKQIWTPDLYIWNSTALKAKEEWASLKQSKVSTNELLSETELLNSYTTVELQYEIKTTVYCNFHFDQYPMDEQTCSIKIGSGSGEAIFVLKDKEEGYHTVKSYNAVGKNITIKFFGKGNLNGSDTIGFQVKMTRLLRPYVMKYYIPSMAVVLVSEIGFVIPLTAIPGRVALLVTQFLTLVNLFIYHMVNSKRYQIIQDICFNIFHIFINSSKYKHQFILFS